MWTGTQAPIYRRSIKMDTHVWILCGDSLDWCRFHEPYRRTDAVSLLLTVTQITCINLNQVTYISLSISHDNEAISPAFGDRPTTPVLQQTFQYGSKEVTSPIHTWRWANLSFPIVVGQQMAYPHHFTSAVCVGGR